MDHIASYTAWKKRKIIIFNFEPKLTIGRRIIPTVFRNITVPILSYNYFDDEIMDKWKDDKHDIIGMVFTGSRYSLGSAYGPSIPDEILRYKVPKLGICFGHELLGNFVGAEIVDCNVDVGEKTPCFAELDTKCLLFDGLKDKEMVTMSHGKMIRNLPENIKKIASTHLTPIAGFEAEFLKFKIWGVQFHPELNYLHDTIFWNFANHCYREYYPKTN